MSSHSTIYTKLKKYSEFVDYPIYVMMEVEKSRKVDMTEEEIELLTAALKLQKSIIAVDEFTDASLQNIISSSKQRINQHIVNTKSVVSALALTP